jgi:hypothetical protein
MSFFPGQEKGSQAADFCPVTAKKYRQKLLKL